MTATEMEELFLIEYDRVTSFDAPGYTANEISEILSSAQEQLIFHTYNPLGNKYQKGLEEVELTTADLQELVSESNLTSSASQIGVLTNGRFFDLPVNHWLTLMEEVTIATDSCFNGAKGIVKPITHDEYTINRNNPFKKPAVNEVTWRLTNSGRRFELVTDGNYTITTYNMRYLIKPQPIITATGITVDGVAGPLNCQLKSTTHRRIVKYAVRIAAGITDAQMYQVKTIEQNSGN
jgi:hypothetical protein|tara:strand:+ start:16570 stop:17277 length:708 start_codon:yes stop_codon:yes gene_type:complete